MNQYEVMYVIDNALEEQVRQDTIARFSALVAQNGGQVDRIDEWGKRKLAYAIDYKTEGYYVLMYITAPAALPRELERNLKNADAILRYLVIRFEGTLPPKREPLKPYVAPAAAAPEASATPEAPTETAAPETPTEAAPEVPVAPETPESPAAEPVEAPAEA